MDMAADFEWSRSQWNPSVMTNPIFVARQATTIQPKTLLVSCINIAGSDGNNSGIVAVELPRFARDISIVGGNCQRRRPY